MAWIKTYFRVGTLPAEVTAAFGSDAAPLFGGGEQKGPSVLSKSKMWMFLISEIGVWKRAGATADDLAGFAVWIFHHSESQAGAATTSYSSPVADDKRKWLRTPTGHITLLCEQLGSGSLSDSPRFSPAVQKAMKDWSTRLNTFVAVSENYLQVTYHRAKAELVRDHQLVSNSYGKDGLLALVNLYAPQYLWDDVGSLTDEDLRWRASVLKCITPAKAAADVRNDLLVSWNGLSFDSIAERHLTDKTTDFLRFFSGEVFLLKGSSGMDDSSLKVAMATFRDDEIKKVSESVWRDIQSVRLAAKMQILAEGGDLATVLKRALAGVTGGGGAAAPPVVVVGGGGGAPPPPAEAKRPSADTQLVSNIFPGYMGQIDPEGGKFIRRILAEAYPVMDPSGKLAIRPNNDVVNDNIIAQLKATAGHSPFLEFGRGVFRYFQAVPADLGLSRTDASSHGERLGQILAKNAHPGPRGKVSFIAAMDSLDGKVAAPVSDAPVAALQTELDVELDEWKNRAGDDGAPLLRLLATGRHALRAFPVDAQHLLGSVHTDQQWKEYEKNVIMPIAEGLRKALPPRIDNFSDLKTVEQFQNMKMFTGDEVEDLTNLRGLFGKLDAQVFDHIQGDNGLRGLDLATYEVIGHEVGRLANDALDQMRGEEYRVTAQDFGPQLAVVRKELTKALADAAAASTEAARVPTLMKEVNEARDRADQEADEKRVAIEALARTKNEVVEEQRKLADATRERDEAKKKFEDIKSATAAAAAAAAAPAAAGAAVVNVAALNAELATRGLTIADQEKQIDRLADEKKTLQLDVQNEKLITAQLQKDKTALKQKEADLLKLNSSLDKEKKEAETKLQESKDREKALAKKYADKKDIIAKLKAAPGAGGSTGGGDWKGWADVTAAVGGLPLLGEFKEDGDLSTYGLAIDVVGHSSHVTITDWSKFGDHRGSQAMAKKLIQAMGVHESRMSGTGLGIIGFPFTRRFPRGASGPYLGDNPDGATIGEEAFRIYLHNTGKTLRDLYVEEDEWDRRLRKKEE